jgi:hypothetical protein
MRKSYPIFFIHLVLPSSSCKIFPQHRILEISRPMIFPQRDRYKVSHLYKMKAIYISVYLNVYIFGEQSEIQKTVDQMLAGIP